MIRSLLMACALGLVACHGPGGATTTGASAPHRIDYAEYELLDRFEGLARSLELSKGDCAGLADRLGAWVASNQDDLPKLTAEARGGTNLDPPEIAKINERIEEVLGQVVDSAKTCQGAGGAQTAWTRFDALLERT